MHGPPLVRSLPQWQVSWVGWQTLLSESGWGCQDGSQMWASSAGTHSNCCCLGYKQAKAQMVLELKESSDHLVRAVGTQVRTGRRWKTEEEVDQAIGMLKARRLAGSKWVKQVLARVRPPFSGQRPQSGRGKPWWWRNWQCLSWNAIPSKQYLRADWGGWSTWEVVMGRPMTWPNLWKTPQDSLSFLIQATYLAPKSPPVVRY